MSPEPGHVPVLLERCLELLGPALSRPGAVAVDATLGLGGHTEAMLAAHPELDGRRPGPRHRGAGPGRRTGWLRSASGSAPVHCVYDQLPEALGGLGYRRVDAILFDLGVSSMQLDVADRGLRLLPGRRRWTCAWTRPQGITAAEVLNTYPVGELARILRTYGEEKFAGPLARAIVREREREPFTTSPRLVELIRDTIPAPARRTGGNPAKRTFQALRIEVNAELDVLRRAIPAALSVLAVGGRMVVLSYHSGEDRIVKARPDARHQPAPSRTGCR